MSESLNHYKYVLKIYNYIKNTVNKNSMIKADIFECERPRLTYSNYIPDVICYDNDHLYIGEAKTASDYDRKHSLDQYESYFKECLMFPGNSTFIICLPWNLIITAKNHFKRLKNKFNATKVNIIILSDNDMEIKL